MMSKDLKKTLLIIGKVVLGSVVIAGVGALLGPDMARSLRTEADKIWSDLRI